MYINLEEMMRLNGRLSDVKASLKGALDGVADELIDVNNNIRSSELVNSNENIRRKIDDLTTKLNTNLEELYNFLNEQIEKYKGTNADAKEALESLVSLINTSFDSNGNVIAPVATSSIASTMSTNMYDAPTTGNSVEDYLAGVEGSAVNLPAGLGRSHTYMGWQLITSKSSPQYKLREAAGMNFDENGFGKIGDRYVVATTTTYGNVGDYIDVVQSDGTVIKGIIGDIKNQNDRGCNMWGHDNGQSVVEFVVDKNSWYHTSKTVDSFHPEWKSTVSQIVNKGNYFDLNE